MQLKFLKKSTLLLTLVLLLDVVAIAGLIIYRDLWADKKILTIAIAVGVLFILSTLYSNYDLNADKNYIKKCVRNGDVAIAKITKATFDRFARDARLKNHVYWRLNVELYDNDMKKFNTTIVEKFSTHQTSLPKGFVFVTYIEGKEEDCLIIPNTIISSIEPYRELALDYEKALKPTYLNVYYNNGLIIQTYSDAMKDQRKWAELDEKFK